MRGGAVELRGSLLVEPRSALEALADACLVVHPGDATTLARVAEAWVEELSEWLRIPSVSADPVHAEDVWRAAEWLRDLIRGAGGDAEVTPAHARPLVVGELRASTHPERAPTVLLYGHFDVQPPEPLELWETPPFEPTVRGEWLVARGATDDKGNLYVLLKAACELARAGALPVNVRIVSDGEEEIGGTAVVDWIRADEGPADACVIFDGGMLGRDRPSFALMVRGALAFQLRIRASACDIHSGYGNTVLNATHALVASLSALLPRDGRLPEPLRAGVRPAADDERAAWADLKDGHEWLTEIGAVPHDERAGDEFHLRISREPALDVNGILGGKPGKLNTTIPAEAQANFTVRLVPGQDVDEITAAVERLVREAAPRGAEVELVREAAAAPGETPADARAIEIALGVFERAFGVRPQLHRGGGTLPIFSALAARAIPTVATGFGLPESNVHAPNERFLLEYLPLGVAIARELLTELAALPLDSRA